MASPTSSLATLVARDPGRWHSAKLAAANGPRILIATTVTGFNHATLLEATLALALTLRGASVEFLACDAALPACLKVEPHSVPDPATIVSYQIDTTLCEPCMAIGREAFEPLDLPITTLSTLLAPSDLNRARTVAAEVDIERLTEFELNGLAVGEHALAGALRYFARGDLPSNAIGEMVARRYLEASIRMAFAMKALLARQRYHAACFHHGIYVPQGVIGEACRAAGIPLTNWNPSYRRNTFIFSHGDTYHHTLLDEPVSAWKGLELSPDQETEIVEYLNSRRVGTRDWIWFHEKPDEAFADYAQTKGIDLSKPIIGLLTNVIWDAQLHYRANAFPNMIDWVLRTIRYFKEHPDLQLLIRIHPAEIRGTVPSRQTMMEEISSVFPELPGNVFIIAPEDNISTYAAMDHCDSVLIYGTKTGVELVSFGIPVIVGGEAWIRNKGLTSDATCPDTYFALLDQLPLGKRLSPELVREARKYAYHFFFRRMIPLPFIEPGKKIYELKLDSLEELAPGNSPGLDIICDGILNGTPYTYPAERLGLHDL